MRTPIIRQDRVSPLKLADAHCQSGVLQFPCELPRSLLWPDYMSRADSACSKDALQSVALAARLQGDIGLASLGLYTMAFASKLLVTWVALLLLPRARFA